MQLKKTNLKLKTSLFCITICLLLILPGALCAQNDLLIATKVDLKEIDGWWGQDSTERFYDANNNLIFVYFLREGSKEWERVSKDSFSYDAKDRLRTITSLSSSPALGWHNSIQLDFEYNMAGQLISESYYLWSGKWVPYSQNKHVRNNRGQIISSTLKDWDKNMWVNSELQTFEYDDSLNQILYTYSVWDSVRWEGFRLMEKQYDSNNNLIQETGKIWYNAVWNNSHQLKYNYDNNSSLVDKTIFDFKDSTWVRDQLLSFEYDLAGQLKEEFRYRWRDSIWINEWKRMFDYDTHDNLVEELRVIWRNDMFNIYERRKNYYRFTTSVPDLELQKLNLKVYPNPNDGLFTIDVAQPFYESIDYKIFSSLGQLVYNGTLDPGPGNKSLRLDRLSDGSYYILFRDERSTLPFIIKQ